VSQQRAEAALASQGLETSRGVLSGRNAGKDIEYENAFARRGSIIRAERERASVERARIEEEYARTSVAARRASLAANQVGSQQIMTGGIITALAPAAASAASRGYGSASTPAAASTTTSTTDTGGWV
jgi:acyl-coenzyme A thioesterase PaaI-like protein